MKPITRRLRKLQGSNKSGNYDSFQITLPKQLVQTLGWNYDQVIEVQLKGDQIILMREKEIEGCG